MIRILLILALALQGCTAIDAVTAARLGTTDPLSADPAVYRVIAHLPEGLEIIPGSARLVLVATRDGQTAGGEFVLDRQTSGRQSAFSVADRDLPALRAAQAAARTWETEDPQGTSGSLSLSFGLCTVDGGPDMDVPVSAEIAIDGGTPRPLLRPTPVRRYLAMMRQAGRPVGPCENTA
ncbi:hypothetical protein KUH32_04325 [Thalassococcus sp. CAU 1522]|uniref:Lipoprotein n=1 Tax=Thalassococcus arenae TaxID=2851652 RepID=A0ABS6N4Q0_9RHOB|nr:hypothetical protein [Thalassococcus arenae]MBV2358992.1 hypothetical protein [Thalassococcus arenae]